ncbi:DUF1877 family protein [Streptomyces sp. HUAS ZL42]|uniref:DUF1877 family protein n=1 Tax=Streptomyces sp. HUAS ZL42 TaxID=3231715 RepID=UPI00345EE190
MSMYFHFRAVPPSALRNSAAWLRRLFDDDWQAVRERIDRHREEMLDGHYRDHQLLYTDMPPELADAGPEAHVVLGGQRVFPSDPGQSPFLLLTAAQTSRVAAFLTSTDFDQLWGPARAELLPRYGGAAAEPQARAAFASAHRDLTAFYTTTADYGDAVVKWVVS